MRRFGMALVVAIALVALTAPTGLATRPDRGVFEWTDSGPVSGVCSFTFTVTAHLIDTYETFYDSAGNEVAYGDHYLQQDTFTGLHGQTLIGDAYRWYMRTEFDSTGAMTRQFATGAIERVTLPDGTRFWSMGRVDTLSGGGPWLVPDSGHAGNLDAFCAALE